MLARFSVWFLWIVALVSGLTFGSKGARSSPELWFLSVGQGDCAVLRYDGLTLLIDAGPAKEDADTASRQIMSDLRRMGVNRIDLVLLSHPDSDHIGGLRGLSGSISIRRAAAMAHFKGHPDLARWLSSAGISDKDVLWLERGTTLRFGGGSARVDSVKYAPGDPDNHGSMFVRVVADGARAVFSGDADSVAEMSVIRDVDWSAEVLKAGHHGSKSSTCGAWIEAIRPGVAILSCGKNNSYGHPAPETLERLRQAGIRTLRTDLEGDIGFVVRGGKFDRLE